MSHTIIPRLLIVAAGFLFCTVPSLAADIEWTGWLGPHRTGRVEGYTPPASWPDQLEKQWQMDVGIGYGSPLVADGRIWQHARQGDNEVVWCLDLATGETIWQQSYNTPFKIGGGAEFHGKGPKSSPAMADGRLFTLSITGLLCAWNAETGQQLWQRDYSREFKPNHPYWGAS
ncbi:MAG: PQQ-binding-like beta-propeller repeat protein, partial [Maioricimonas sp. JB049]